MTIWESDIRCWSAQLPNSLSSAWISGILFAAALLLPIRVFAHELTITYGGGSQPGAPQHNTSGGVDYSFATFERSAKQHLSLGVSYTQIRTDADSDTQLWAVSLYPQLSLYPEESGRFRNFFPDWANPFFFVRALGPSYLSSNRLGERDQADHFAFQAQVGFGLLLDLGQNRQGVAALSWKHFSNANLFNDNDGIDIPLLLSLGVRF